MYISAFDCAFTTLTHAEPSSLCMHDGRSKCRPYTRDCQCWHLLGKPHAQLGSGHNFNAAFAQLGGPSVLGGIVLYMCALESSC